MQDCSRSLRDLVLGQYIPVWLSALVVGLVVMGMVPPQSTTSECAEAFGSTHAPQLKLKEDKRMGKGADEMSKKNEYSVEARHTGADDLVDEELQAKHVPQPEAGDGNPRKHRADAREHD
jgi:hypothetical protein